MSIIKSVTLEKRRNIHRMGEETVATVEFNQERYAVLLSESDELRRHSRCNPSYEAHQRRHQIEQVAHRITSDIRHEIAEALTRLDTVVRNGEAITLRIAR